MQCAACGQVISVDGVFPGGSVTCACGATAVVPLVSPPLSPAVAAAEAARATPAPPVASDGHGAPTCPRCQALLVIREEGGVVVTSCPSEHGLFIGHTALDELTKHAPLSTAAALDAGASLALPVAPTSAPEVPAALRCPRCNEPMATRTFARGTNIVVDVCPDHGTWFDAGELRAARLAGAAPADSDAATLAQQAAATLDVALALEHARDEETAREGIALADDVLETFNHVVLGRTRVGSRYR